MDAPTTAAPTVPGRWRPVGRAAEISFVRERVASLAAGRGGVCWVSGDPGVGKSTLLVLAGEFAADAGCVVLRGSADELHRGVPLSAILACLDAQAPLL